MSQEELGLTVISEVTFFLYVKMRETAANGLSYEEGGWKETQWPFLPAQIK